MPRQWFVGVTHQAKEVLAKRELQNQGFETYLPMCLIEWARKPKIKPFLPSYIFIGLNPDCDRWRSVFSTYGMRTVLCSGDKPQAAPDWIVNQIKEREVDGLVRLPPKAQCKFKSGDVVKLRGSPVDAIFDEVVDHRRAAVFLSLLGRANRLIVPLTKIVSSPVAAVA